MKIKTWILSGVIYLGLVVTGYSIISGENPLSSGDMNHDGHSNEEAQHNDHGSNSYSEVQTDVTYDDGQVVIGLEDEEGNIPELEETHEKLMHLIVVSKDLEEYVHLHPELNEDHLYSTEVTLNKGHYQAFVDIAPKEKEYRVEANEVMVGKSEATEAHLAPTSDTQTVSNKDVTLEASGLSTDESTVLSFDLHGDIPKPYLGALGHVVILNESADEFIHVHPVSDNETTFETHFETPGLYKVWAEFNFEDAGVLIFPYVIEIK